MPPPAPAPLNETLLFILVHHVVLTIYNSKITIRTNIEILYQLQYYICIAYVLYIFPLLRGGFPWASHSVTAIHPARKTSLASALTTHLFSLVREREGGDWWMPIKTKKLTYFFVELSATRRLGLNKQYFNGFDLSFAQLQSKKSN